MNEPSASPASDKIAALEKRKTEILANEQDWMREDRAAQIDKEIRELGSRGLDGQVSDGQPASDRESASQIATPEVSIEFPNG